MGSGCLAVEVGGRGVSLVYWVVVTRLPHAPRSPPPTTIQKQTPPLHRPTLLCFPDSATLKLTLTLLIYAIGAVLIERRPTICKH
eukprot:scaffold97_cov193-Alexandrium_tamarense.AAC.21